MNALVRLGRALRKAAEAASIAAFAAMFLLFLAGVAMRYLTDAPLAWSDELIMVIFLWSMFLTEALVITEREQITFDAIYDVVGERTRRIIAALASLVIAGLYIVALPVVLDYLLFLGGRGFRTNALQWRLDLVYGCFLVYWAAVVVRAFIKLAMLLGPKWRDTVALVSPDARSNLLG